MSYIPGYDSWKLAYPPEFDEEDQEERERAEDEYGDYLCDEMRYEAVFGEN